MGTIEVAELLRHQANMCAGIGSAFYAELLRSSAADVDAGGPVRPLVEPFAGLPATEVVGVRLMGAMHRVVLEGGAPELEARYPSTGGDGDAAAAWPALRELAAARRERLLELMEHGVQTNEVGRAACLVGGFLMVARETGLPLRIREMGSSAGLLLLWDRYRYETATQSFGPADSPVGFGPGIWDPPPPLAGDLKVADRLGCDRDPIDPTTEDGRLTLLSYVWADQTHRFELIRAALDVAAAEPVEVERADGLTWIAEQVAEPAPGAATVVFHSIVMQYLTEEQRATVRTKLEEAGARAARDAPLAWLRMEPHDAERAHVHLTTWPGGEERLLAAVGYHGRPVCWRL